ncbi:MAG TPA: hypothetical protein VGJ12_02380, partial [Gemmatimonadaceae bacterium]
IFCARVYRAAEDAKRAATGWALEREGDGDVNAVACLENTETSAIGRALANLGFTASAERPSREEMQRVARARQAPLRVSAPRPRSAAPVPAFSPLLQSHADALSDALSLLAVARQAGMRPARAARTSARLLAHPPTREELARIASRLRAWLHRQRELNTAAV